MALNLGTILHASATNYPDREVIRIGDQRITYAELDRAAAGVASGLGAQGIAPGDRVALLLPNVPEFTIAYFGILYAGAVVVPINVLASANEVQYFLEDSGAQRIFVHPLFADAGEEGAQAAGVPVIGSGGEGEGTLEELVAHDSIGSPLATAAEDTAVILYTSGTTGQPKGAELTHTNLFLNAAFIMPRLLGLEGETYRALATLPLFHSFGQTCIQNGAIAASGSFTLLPRFDPGSALDLIERDRLTLFAGVPTMYFAMLRHQGEKEPDVSSLQRCLTGGAPMPVEVMSEFETKYPVKILEGYGLSETSPVASFNVLHRPRQAGSIGFPVWGIEMCIQDETGRELGDGERGEICIRGHNVMKGYLDRPEATAEALEGGWFHSGDIGYRDESGCYWIVDRKKDMVLRGGFNVYPREVEEVLYQHEAIAEAAVIGIPHPSHGEEVKAVVSLVAGAEADQDSIIEFCRERMAAYKYPRIVEIIDALPKGPTGKILKRELR